MSLDNEWRMSAMPLITDIERTMADVRWVPEGVVALATQDGLMVARSCVGCCRARWWSIWCQH
jgi:hypothetical protein